jgi:hypothetical protein
MGETGKALLEFTARAGTKTGCDANPFDIGNVPNVTRQRRVARRVSPRRGPRPAQVVHRGWGLLVSCVPCLRPRAGTAAAGRTGVETREGRSGTVQVHRLSVSPLSGFTLVVAFSCVSLIGLSRYALALSRASLWGRQS